MLVALWSENKPPSIFGSLKSKTLPKSVARLANVSARAPEAPARAPQCRLAASVP
jgi:hypothetical protein